MAHPDLTQLNIQISARDATEEDIDLMTRQLLSELRETDVETAELVKEGEAPRGTKSGDAVTMGSVVISALPTARGQGRTVKFKGKVGKEVIDALSKGKKR